MTEFRRYAIYAVPEGALYAYGAAWLGWDSITGQAVPQSDLPDVPVGTQDLTRTPRKYGFHGTIKAPFRLRDGLSRAEVEHALAAFCGAQRGVEVPLKVALLGQFVALIPAVAAPALDGLAAATVRALDPMRAPLTPAERQRRKPDRLSPAQRVHLDQWGYPFVMDQFRFHLTLTGGVAPADRAPVLVALAAHFAPVLDQPYRLGSLCLMGEAEDGRFHLLHRQTLAG